MVELPIPKDTFVNADEKTYRSLEYDMLSHILNCNEVCRIDHDKILVEHASEIVKLKKRKWWDKGLAMVTAAIVAMATILGFSIKG